MPRKRGSRGNATRRAKKNSRGGKTNTSRPPYRNHQTKLSEDEGDATKSSTRSTTITSNKRVREVDCTLTPKASANVEPVEQRWEEMAGKYMHKKFKKIASSLTEQEPHEIAQSAPVSNIVPPPSNHQSPVPIPGVKPSVPIYNHFPLKHSALSLVQTSRHGTTPGRGINVLSSLRHAHNLPNSLQEYIQNQPDVTGECNVAIEDEDSATKKRNVCPFCQMVCAKPSVLDKHIRTHTNERPYPCEPCGFAFKTKSNLYKHCKSRTHSLKIEKGIDSSSADIMAELGDTLREEIEPTQPYSTSISPMLSNSTSLNRITDSPNQNQSFENHHRPVTLQQLPTTSTFVTPVIYTKPIQEHYYSSSQHLNLYPDSSNSKHITLTQDSQRIPSTMFSMPLQYGIMSPGNYTNMCLPHAQPLLVRSQGTGNPAMVKDKRQITIIQDNRSRIPMAPLPQQVPVQTSAQLITTSATKPIEAVSNRPREVLLNKVAPEFIQQRIDKVINENQAIVETFDPLWPRRYTRQSSKDNDSIDKSHNRTGNRKYNPASIMTSSSFSTNSSSTTYSTVISNAPFRPMESLSPFPKHPISLLTAVATSPKILTSPLPQHHEKAKQDQVHVMPANPIDLALSRKRTITESSSIGMTSASEDRLCYAQSVKEVWINSCKNQGMITTTVKPSTNVTQVETISTNTDTSLPFHPENPEGSMIKELLLKTRIINLVPTVSSSSHIRRESTSSNGSVSHIILDQINLNRPSSKPPEVSLILTSSTSPPKTKVLNPATQSPNLVHCNLCQKSFQGRDLDLHQRDYCTAVNKMSEDELEESSMSPKRARLSHVGQNSHHTPTSSSVTPGKQLYAATGGGIVSLSKVSPTVSQLGLLQIAQPTHHSGGGIVTTASDLSNGQLNASASPSMKLDLQSIIPTSIFSIPGVPTPNLSGVLANMKVSPIPLFSMTGRRLDFTCPTSESTSQRSEIAKPVKPVPFVPGMPGPYSHPSTVPTPTSTKSNTSSSLMSPPLSLCAKSSSASQTSSSTWQIKVEVSDEPTTEESKFLRPTSLQLTPGTFKVKKQVMAASGATATLVSPETPRPRKSYALQYQNGTAYTYLGMKCSTRVCYCCIFRPQPMYVVHKAKLSMYSNWRVVSKDSHPSGLAPAVGLGAYNSGYRQTSFGFFTSANSTSSKNLTVTEDNKSRVDDCQMIVTHSSKWKKVSGDGDGDKTSPTGSSKNVLITGEKKASQGRTLSPDQGANRLALTPSASVLPSAPSTVEGGYKSLDDDYTYVRGRGRGRYVCSSCGIRCKKPSMLKKHIRTHSNFRPYTCRHCNFAFKTKGNLTKHMKSKAHHKKCVELGISPVPTTVEETQQDLTVNGMEQSSSMHAGDSDSDDDDMEEEEDEEEDQFEDAEIDADSFPTILTHSGNEGNKQPPGQDKEGVTRSLLSVQMDSEMNRSIPIDSSSVLVHQGLLPCRPTPSTYSSEKLSLGKCTPLTSEIPVSSEQALIFDNTKKVQDLQTESLETSLNLKQFPPKNTSERYYFSSPNILATTPMTMTSTSDKSIFASSASMTSSTAVIWSIARMSHTSPSTSVQNQRTNLFPLDICGGAISIYKATSSITSTTVSSTPALVSDVKSSEGKIPIKEQPADILSPVTKSPSMVSYINKSSLIATNTPKVFETELNPPPLSAYLQERAAVRAVNKNALSTSPKLTEKSEKITPVNVMTSNSMITATTSSSAIKQSIGYPSEDKYAPRNVTMNVKDLPKDVNSSNTLKHPQLPEDIHLATANAMAKSSSSAISTSQATSIGSHENNQSNQKNSSKTNSDGEQQTEIFQTNEDGKSVCGICNKIFSKSSQLRLHVNIHYFERPFRCDSCSVSFRTKGHLQKHKRSVGHFKKVNINETFGTPTTSDPRPFKCTECKIAFRIHGHLAKHLRSKMHIMKLECLGKLPIGMFAEMERLGTNLNDIDTSDCENSLESLQQIAVRLYQQDPSKLIGKTEADLCANGSEPTVGSDVSDTDESDLHQGEIKTETTTTKIQNEEQQQSLTKPQQPNPVNGTHQQNPVNGTHQPNLVNGTHQPNPVNGTHQPNPRSMPKLTPPTCDSHLRRASFSSSGHEDHSTDSEVESHKKTHRCSQCYENFADFKSLQIHIVVEHQSSKSNSTVANLASNSISNQSRKFSTVANSAAVSTTNHYPPNRQNEHHLHNTTQIRNNHNNQPPNHNTHNDQPPNHNTRNNQPLGQDLRNLHSASVQPHLHQSGAALNLQNKSFRHLENNSHILLHNLHQDRDSAPHFSVGRNSQVEHNSNFKSNTSPALHVQKKSSYNSSSSPIVHNPVCTSPAYHYALSNIPPSTVISNGRLPDLMLNGHRRNSSVSYRRQTSSSSSSDQYEERSPSKIPQGQQQNQFRCDLCGVAGMANREELKQHLISHTAQRPFVCARCDAGFVSYHQLESHLQLHETS